MYEQRDHERLIQFVRWLTPIIFVFALTYGVIGFWFADWATQLCSGIIAGYGVMLIAMRPLLQQGRHVLVAHLVSGGLLVAVLLMTALQPALYPNHAVVPVLAAALLLQYMLQGHTTWSLIACGIATACIGVMGELLPSDSRLSPGFLSILRVSSLTGTVAFTLLLLVQFKDRVQDLVAQVRSVNATLELRNTELEAKSQALYEQLVTEQRLTAQVAALEAPVVTLAERVLFAAVVGHLDARRAQALQDKLMRHVFEVKAASIIIDLTGVAQIEDSEIVALIRMIQAIKLLGCEVMVSGISPEVAQRLGTRDAALELHAQTRRTPHEALEAIGFSQRPERRPTR